ncbi:MAG TPA: hypothetical protein VKY27_03995 [Bacteriovoracaceae bacterium]|nr:hypothetical protein [Bacteriovoracaceae bacterium]
MEPSFENVHNIYPLNYSKTFTHQEALDLIPLLQRISSKTKKELSVLNSQLSFARNNSPRAIELQEQINHVLQNWSEKVRRLGAVPVALCKVRIPGEEGQYLWEYPENKLFLH